MVELGQEGVARVWGTVQNTFKVSGTEKRRGETKILKRWQAGSRKGSWNSITNYAFQKVVLK